MIAALSSGKPPRMACRGAGVLPNVSGVTSYFRKFRGGLQPRSSGRPERSHPDCPLRGRQTHAQCLVPRVFQQRGRQLLQKILPALVLAPSQDSLAGQQIKYGANAHLFSGRHGIPRRRVRRLRKQKSNSNFAYPRPICSNGNRFELRALLTHPRFHTSNLQRGFRALPRARPPPPRR